MAKGDKFKKNLQDEERLISMSAKSAKQLNAGFKGAAAALKEVMKAMKGVKEEIDGGKEGWTHWQTEADKGKNIAQSLGESVGGLAKKIDKTGTLSKMLAGNFKKAFKFSNLATAGNAAMTATLIQGIMELDRLQTQYAKSFGLTEGQAREVHKRMSDIARASGRNSITWIEMHKTMDGIAQATGILAKGLRDDVLEEAAELQKLMGISNQGAANLAFNAQVTGQHMEEQSLSMARGVISAEEMVGANIDAAAAFKTASELTGVIRANIGRSYEDIIRVVGKAQAWGLTMQDLANTSSKLLNFQSSIEAELTAELFLGRQLNLEKARMYALTGDYEKLQQEIVNNLGSEFEFLQMNVMQKQKFADAMGMSVDGLSNMIMKQTDLNSLMEQAEARGETEILKQLKAQALQQEFNDLVQKMQTSFIDIAEGPLGDIGNFLSRVVQSASALYTIMGLIVALKIMGLVQSVIALGTALQTAGIAAGLAKAMIHPGKALAGLVVAGILTAGMVRLFAGGKQSAESDNQIKVKSKQNLGDEEIATVEHGSLISHAGESTIRTDGNLFPAIKGLLQDILLETKNNKPHAPLAKHEVPTFYR